MIWLVIFYTKKSRIELMIGIKFSLSSPLLKSAGFPGFFRNFVVVKNMLQLIKRQDNNGLTKLTDKTG